MAPSALCDCCCYGKCKKCTKNALITKWWLSPALLLSSLCQISAVGSAGICCDSSAVWLSCQRSGCVQGLRALKPLHGLGPEYLGEIHGTQPECRHSRVNVGLYWAGPPHTGLLQSRSPSTGELPAVFPSFIFVHLVRNVCAVYCILEQKIFLQMLYKSSSLGALCSPLLLRIPPEWSAGGEGKREGKQAGMLSTLKPIQTLKAECEK